MREKRFLPAKPLRAAALGLLLVTALLIAALYCIDPGKQGFIPCAFYQLTGFYCAGCGTARALHSLLHGDIARAFSQNALSLLLLPPTVLLLFSGLFGKGFLKQRALLVFGIIAIAAGIIFTILRNIPLEIFAVLRP